MTFSIRGLLIFIYEVIYWKIISCVGPYNRYAVVSCLQPNQKSRKHSKTIAITAVAWFVSNVFIVANYEAYSSAESLRAFPYMTKYERLVDLENL